VDEALISQLKKILTTFLITIKAMLLCSKCTKS